MDTSDFYDIAVNALHALQESSAPFSKQRSDSIKELRDFVRAADEEIAANNTRDNWRCHQRELDRKAGD